MLVHPVHAENEASESPPRAGSRAAARIQPGRHPGLPLHAEEEGEVKSRDCWGVRTVPPLGPATLCTAAQIAPGLVFALRWNGSLPVLGVLDAAASKPG